MIAFYRAQILKNGQEKSVSGFVVDSCFEETNYMQAASRIEELYNENLISIDKIKVLKSDNDYFINGESMDEKTLNEFVECAITVKIESDRAKYDQKMEEGASAETSVEASVETNSSTSTVWRPVPPPEVVES